MKSLIFLMIATCIFISCKKESFIESKEAKLSVSEDTLHFDTVFTTVGSVTQSFKIFNNNSQKLRLTQVKLAGGNSSQFKINVDGISAPEVNNIEVNGNDSLYVFVQVNVNPGNLELPFLLSDSIQIDYNGNTQWVQLEAFGQNAIFLKNKIITGTQTWDAKLPYVISGGLQIDTNAVLNISAGTRIYLHADVPILVDGTVRAIGNTNARITFAGDRLDPDYKDFPAAWPGIYFRNTSKNNLLKNVIIKNAYQGVVAQSLQASGTPKVTMSQCIIDNVYDAGILGINTSIYADNCLISNCGSNVNLVYGGDYQFVNCTIVTYGNLFIDHKNPVLQVADFISQDGSILAAPLTALFQNTIVWGENGSVDNEAVVTKKGSSIFSVKFDHVLYKSKEDPANVNFISSIKNIPPAFDSINASKRIFDFHIQPGGPGINAGVATSFLYDLDGKARDQKPDLGCYEL